MQSRGEKNEERPRQRCAASGRGLGGLLRVQKEDGDLMPFGTHMQKDTLGYNMCEGVRDTQKVLIAFKRGCPDTGGTGWQRGGGGPGLGGYLIGGEQQRSPHGAQHTARPASRCTERQRSGSGGARCLGAVAGRRQQRAGSARLPPPPGGNGSSRGLLILKSCFGMVVLSSCPAAGRQLLAWCCQPAHRHCPSRREGRRHRRHALVAAAATHAVPPTPRSARREHQARQCDAAGQHQHRHRAGHLEHGPLEVLGGALSGGAGSGGAGAAVHARAARGGGGGSRAKR